MLERQFGITRMLGRQESHWFEGPTFNTTPKLPALCGSDVPIGDENRRHCLRWPARALSGRGACPLGKSDVVPYSRDVLNLPLCRSHLRKLRRGCLVYSFGIGGDARWENYMAREQ